MVGPRSELSMEECADNAVAFLNRVKGQAEDLGVTICLENLNSKVDHKGYMFDRTPWGFEIVKRVDSPRVKVLFDVYHAQVQEGDVTRTLRENIDWIGHIHFAGNPGRCQIDEEQELNYPFIAREIARLGYTGYVGLEYMPKRGRRCDRVSEAGVRDRRHSELVTGRALGREHGGRGTGEGAQAMPGQIVIGLDVGTTSVKAVAITADGEVTGKAVEQYKLRMPRPGWAEQDPEAWWRATKRALARLERRARGHRSDGPDARTCLP